MAKKLVSCIVVWAILVTQSMGVLAVDYQSAMDAIADANSFLDEKIQLTNYYKLDANNKHINENYAKNGTNTFSNKPIFVYGNREKASGDATGSSGMPFKNIDGKLEYRAIGYARDDSTFPNPIFPHDNEGYRSDDKKWVKEPWGRNGNKKIHGEDGNVYERDISDAMFDYIKKWIKSNLFKPDDVERTTGQRDFFSSRAVDPPKGVKNFEDFLYIIQPPTQHSWGIGIAFYLWNGNSRLNYKSFLLKPFDMDATDLSAQFEPDVSSVAEGKDVLIGVSVKSTFEEELANVPFKWEITKANGETVVAEFVGEATTKEGNIDIAAKGEKLLYASFTMPDSAVNIKFEINRDGKSPVEIELDNNVLDTTINVVKTIVPPIEENDLEYNVLTRKIDYPLAGENGSIEAQLTLPRGSWNGNATGQLNVTNGTEDLLRDFRVERNPRVDEESSLIVRSPDIHTTVQRKDFGDDPQNGNYLNLTTPWEPKVRNGSVSFGGSVSRPYTYTYKCTAEENCQGHTGYGTTLADFNSGTNTRNVRTFIYNGAPVVPAKVFDNKIDNNSTDQLDKKMWWTSEPYKFNVIRWMCHQAEDDTLYNWTPVSGQYQRTFTQQNSADVEWTAGSTMETDYKSSRDAARGRDYRTSEYDKAVFASDIDFRNVDYPIKSGYYFNPTGSYTFEVETITYKTTQADTKDHKDLVNAAINAFRYESDMIYINNNKEAVNIQNELLPRSGSSYARRSASLTAQDPTGVDDAVLLNVLDRSDSEARYAKKVDEIPYSQESGGYTHEYWKEILEGYEESGTIGSRDSYKYREYIKNGQHIYRITEKTTVTIEINPSNRKVYTHAHMPDGKYTVKAWIGDVGLSSIGNEYKKLGTLRGVSALDEIEVSVKGSMYDDTN